MAGHLGRNTTLVLTRPWRYRRRLQLPREVESECFLCAKHSFSRFREIVSSAELRNLPKIGKDSFWISFHVLLPESRLREYLSAYLRWTRCMPSFIQMQ